MIYLLLGSDDFTKKEFLEQLAVGNGKAKLEVCSFFEPENTVEIMQAANDSNLFGGKKLLRIYDFFSRGGDVGLLQKIKDSSNIIAFLEAKLDKRKTETKALLANKSLEVKEFNIPAGPEFKNWVSQRAKQYNLGLSGKALDFFLLRLGFGNDVGFGEPAYNLWQADSELQKLKQFAGDKALAENDIRDLVSENLDENIFKITNAIGDKNRVLSIRYLTDYMDRLAGDEKAKVISLSGLLAEQFRNILIVQGGADSGFASGKLFVYQKLARNFPEQKLLEALKKLEALDQEVKTTSGPAALQMLMIIESLLK
jgi:DNA polymerase III delta subunit